VSAAINNMFGKDGQAEGNLAVLFRYSQEDAILRELIVNAVVVKLSDPRSVSEIRLGLRLLQHIGTPALVGLVETNRSARAAYDDLLTNRFRKNLLEQWKQLGPSEKHLVDDAAKKVLLAMALRASTDVTDRAHVPPRYVRATIFEKGEDQVSRSVYVLATEHEELGSPPVMERLGMDVIANTQAFGSEREELLAELMLQSRMSIYELVSGLPASAKPVNLSYTYLGDLDWRDGSYPPLRLESAYISGDSFDGANLLQKTKELSSADRIELREGLFPPFQPWPRFVRHTEKNWITRDAAIAKATADRSKY
jgi:hypothetical protein